MLTSVKSLRLDSKLAKAGCCPDKAGIVWLRPDWSQGAVKILLLRQNTFFSVWLQKAVPCFSCDWGLKMVT